MAYRSVGAPGPVERVVSLSIRIVAGICAGAGEPSVNGFHVLQRVLIGLWLWFKNRLRPEVALAARKILALTTTPRSRYRLRTKRLDGPACIQSFL